MGTDAHRAELYSTVREHWGKQAADTVMALLPPWDYTEVARKVDVELAASGLEAKFGELQGQFGQLQAKFGQLEGKFGQLSGKVDSQFGRMITVNAGTMLAFGSVVMAAAKLF